MKAEKVIGIAACAFACVTGSAFANSTTNWFGVTASPATATDVTVKTNGTAVAEVSAIVDAGVITLDGDTELTFEPTDTDPARSDNLVTIESSAVLTPNAFGDLPPSSELVGAQVGFAVAYNGDVTNYYYYAYANGSGAWYAGDGTPPADPAESVAFKITLDYRSQKAKFEVGNTLVADNVAFSGSKLTTVAALGSGSLTEVSAGYEIAMAAVITDGGATTNRYGSVAEAKSAATTAGEGASVQGVSPAGETQVAGATAANGLDYVVCEALGLDMTQPTANIAVEPVSADTAADKITLELAMPDAPEANMVGFQVSDGASYSQTCEYDQIEIPLAAGTYTITPVLK